MPSFTILKPGSTAFDNTIGLTLVQVAQQLGFFTLATLLRPSIPITHLFAEAQLVNRTYGPPPLKVLAAQTLNTQLLTALESAILAADTPRSPSHGQTGMDILADPSDCWHLAAPDITIPQRPSTAPASTGQRLPISALSFPYPPPQYPEAEAAPSDLIRRPAPSTSSETPVIISASDMQQANQASQDRLESAQQCAAFIHDLHTTTQAEHNPAADVLPSSGSSSSGMGCFARHVQLALQAQDHCQSSSYGQSTSQQRDEQQTAHEVLLRSSQQLIMPAGTAQDEGSDLSSAMTSAMHNTVGALEASRPQIEPSDAQSESLLVQRTRTNPLFGDLSQCASTSASSQSLSGSVYVTDVPPCLAAASLLSESASTVPDVFQKIAINESEINEPSAINTAEQAVMLVSEVSSTPAVDGAAERTSTVPAAAAAAKQAATTVLDVSDQDRSNKSAKLRLLLLLVASNKESEDYECGVCMERSVGVYIAPCSHTICGE